MGSQTEPFDGRESVDRHGLVWRHLPSPVAPRAKVQTDHRGGSEKAAAMPRPGWTLRVLEAIAASGEKGMTDDELEVQLGYSSARKRRLELEERGWVEAAYDDVHGSVSWLRLDPRTRQTRAGIPAQVWVLSERARREMR